MTIGLTPRSEAKIFSRQKDALIGETRERPLIPASVLPLSIARPIGGWLPRSDRAFSPPGLVQPVS